MALRTVIVDDEPLARQLLSEFLDADARFSCIAECDGGRSAIETIRRLRPDVVLLDVQMPVVDGFDVLASLEEPTPVVVMVTAHNQHALRAFDHHALDYVLKPVDAGRLELALDRVVARARERAGGFGQPGLLELVQQLRGETGPREERIVLKAGSVILFLEPHELPCVESSGNYLKVVHDGRELLIRESLQSLLARLDERHFLQIHRSFVVHVGAVIEVRLQPGGSDYVAVLRDGRQCPIGRSYRKAVFDRLQAPKE